MKTFAKLVLVGFLALQSASAFSAAPFTGSWKGKGQAVMRPGAPQAKTRKCSEITFQFDQEATQFHLISGHYRCEDLDSNYGTADFNIQGGALIYKGQPIGTLSNQSLSLSVPDEQDGTVFHLTLTLRAGSLDYVEQWFQKGNGAGQPDILLLQVQGTLTRTRW